MINSTTGIVVLKNLPKHVQTISIIEILVDGISWIEWGF